MSEKVNGKLSRQGKRIMVKLATKKGEALFAIPESAKRFRDDDFKEGILAEVTKDHVNRIIEVTIPGCKTVSSAAPAAKGNQRDFKQRGPNNRNFNRPTQRSAASQARGVRELAKASPSIIGGAFTNPYTFIEFDRRPFDQDPHKRGQHQRYSRRMKSIHSEHVPPAFSAYP